MVFMHNIKCVFRCITMHLHNYVFMLGKRKREVNEYRLKCNY